MNDLITKCESELADAIQAIQQPRTNFQLRHFVVGQHDTEPRRWFQCVLELSIKIQNLKRFQIERRRMARQAAQLAKGNEDQRDEAQLLQIGIEESDLAALGAMRETHALFAIFKSFPRSYTRDELDAAEADYWQKRLVRQARQEINACGSIGVGNQDSLEQIGISPGPLLAEARACLEQSGRPSTSLSQSPDTSPAAART